MFLRLRLPMAGDARRDSSPCWPAWRQSCPCRPPPPPPMAWRDSSPCTSILSTQPRRESSPGALFLQILSRPLTSRRFPPPPTYPLPVLSQRFPHPLLASAISVAKNLKPSGSLLCTCRKCIEQRRKGGNVPSVTSSSKTPISVWSTKDLTLG